MSVLVYIDTTGGAIAKHSLEAINYGNKIGDTTVLTNGSIDKNEFISFRKIWC